MHPGRIEYVPGVGIDTEKFRNLPGVREEKRRELGFRAEDILVLTVAEMTANKNHITVLRALAQMKDTPEYEHLHYLIVGRGEQWESLEESARGLGLHGHVHFLGYRSDAPQLYQACDIFAFMPFREGLSVALMEAMSSGMCIVCTKIRGNTDLIEDGVSGVFSRNDPQALAAHLLELARDPERREALGRRAAERAGLFDAKAVHRQVKEIYESVMR